MRRLKLSPVGGFWPSEAVYPVFMTFSTMTRRLSLRDKSDLLILAKQLGASQVWYQRG